MCQTSPHETIGRRDWLRTVSAAAAGFAAPRTVVRARHAGSSIRWRSDFPALDQLVNGKPLAYLDSAATTLRPASVIDAVAGYYRTVNANPSTTLHTLARRSAEEYSAARAAVARFINADPREIVWTRGTTEGINLFASSWGGANLRPGDEILVSVAEHYSNWLPWRAIARRTGASVRVFDVHDDGRLNLEDLERMLSSRTRLVAVSHVSNVLGLINPIDEVVRRAKSVNACVLVDGAQSAPHIPVDVKASGCDFFVFSSHKMLGPMATGVAWARHEILEAMPPYQTGSNMAHDVTFDTEVLEHDGQKFQAGTPNVSGPIGLAAACAYLDGLSRSVIAAHERTLITRALDVLGRGRGLKPIGSTSANERVPVFCFTVDGIAVPALVKALDDEGIAIRGGDMAALPLLERFATKAAARVSLYLYNTVEDIDRLGAVLERLRG
jgi:cysteine desulfurase / selenocysteine lyase